MEDKTLMALRTGFKFGCWMWAIWSDGGQTIGVMKHPLSKSLKEIDDGKHDDKLKEFWIAEGGKYDSERAHREEKELPGA